MGAYTHVTNSLLRNIVVWKGQLGHAIADAGSRWLPTAVTLVRVRAACGVCGGQSGTRVGFIRVLRFPLPVIIISIIIITRGWPQCRVDPIRLHPPPLYHLKKGQLSQML
jgi:hypothetical protein